MTPKQKIKHAIILGVAEYHYHDRIVQEAINNLLVDDANIDESYDFICEVGMQWDVIYEIREGQVETDVPSESSLYYESKSVAMKMPDDTWVGWTYWYGGGKHDEPDAIDWMDKAYDLNCKEEEKVVIVCEFTKFDKTT